MTDHSPFTDEELAEWDAQLDVSGPEPWRRGRKVGRTLYRQRHKGGPADGDRLIGMVDTVALAVLITRACNDVPRLIADLRASRAEVERLRVEMDKAVSSDG